MDAASLLVEAARKIGDHGWWDGKSDASRANGEHCAVTAMQTVAREHQVFAEYQLAYAALSTYVGGGVGDWSDHYVRGHIPVVGTMQKVARRLAQDVDCSTADECSANESVSTPAEGLNGGFVRGTGSLRAPSELPETG